MGVRFLLLGLGSIGMKHAALLEKLGHDVIAIDPDPAKGAHYQSMGAMRYDPDFDGILDCTPPDVRPSWKMYISAPRFIEKPLGNTPSAVLAGPVQMGFCYRYAPRLAEFVLNIQAKGVARVTISGGQHLQDWHIEDYREVSGRYRGVVTDSLPHSVYIARWILGDATYVGATAAHTGAFDLDVEDVAGVVLAGPNNEPCLLSVDYLQRPRAFYIEAVTLDGGWYRWEFAPKEAEEMYTRQMQAWVRLCEGTPDVEYPTLQDGICVQEVLDAISRP